VPERLRQLAGAHGGCNWYIECSRWRTTPTSATRPSNARRSSAPSRAADSAVGGRARVFTARPEPASARAPARRRGPAADPDLVAGLLEDLGGVEDRAHHGRAPVGYESSASWARPAKNSRMAPRTAATPAGSWAETRSAPG
jgi:hypothetical protein